MARWQGRLAAVLVTATLAVGVAGVSPAQALDCKGDPPTLQSPLDAAGAVFDPGPSNAVIGDPFGDPPTSTIYETYGYGGLMWSTYDLGCGPDVARSPLATMGTWMANGLTRFSQAAVGVQASLMRFALNPDQWITPLDTLLERGAQVFREPTTRWLSLAILALAAVMVFRARESRYADTAAYITRIAGIVVVAGILFGAPTQFARMFDTAAAWVVDTVHRGITGDTSSESAELGTGLTANIHEAVLYETWLTGMFGNAQSPTAERFGDAVFAATTRTVYEDRVAQLTPEECAAVSIDPCGAEFAKQLQDERGAEYEALAAEIAVVSPDAYQHLIGQRSDHRFYSALVGGFSALAAVVFNTIAALLMAAGFIAMRLLVMFGFVLVVVAVLWVGKALAAVYATLGLLMTGVWFGIGAGIFAVVQQAFLGSSLPAWAAGFLTLLTAWIFWRFTKRMREVQYAEEYGRKTRDLIPRRRRRSESLVFDEGQIQQEADAEVIDGATSTSASPHVMVVTEDDVEAPATPTSTPTGAPNRPESDDPEATPQGTEQPVPVTTPPPQDVDTPAEPVGKPGAGSEPQPGPVTPGATESASTASQEPPAPPAAERPEVAVVDPNEIPDDVAEVDEQPEEMDGQSVYRVYVVDEKGDES